MIERGRNCPAVQSRDPKRAKQHIRPGFAAHRKSCARWRRRSTPQSWPPDPAGRGAPAARRARWRYCERGRRHGGYRPAAIGAGLDHRLVNSSTKSGTLSVRSTISSTTSGGSGPRLPASRCTSPFAAAEPVQRNHRHLRRSDPGRLELGPVGYDQQHRQACDLLDRKIEQLARGRIDLRCRHPHPTAGIGCERYRRSRPERVALISPARCNVRACLQIAGRLTEKPRARSPARQGRSESRRKISRRIGYPTAVKISSTFATAIS